MMDKEDILSLLLRKGSENAFSFYFLFVVFILLFLYMISFCVRYLIQVKKKKKNDTPFIDKEKKNSSDTPSSQTSPPHETVSHNGSVRDEHRWEDEGGFVHKEE